MSGTRTVPPGTSLRPVHRVENYPIAPHARVTLLAIGYAEPGVASTVSLVEDGVRRIVIDPGMVRTPRDIVRGLARAGVKLDAVTDVVLSHHHPDHTLHAGLFPAARVHDHWAVYQGDQWRSRRAEGFRLSPSVRLLATPGHTAEDITTVVGTASGLVAFTHLWWNRDGPREDPLAEDPRLLHEGRRRVLRWASGVVPGHGAPFSPDSSTPR